MCFSSDILKPALKDHYLESNYSEKFDIYGRNIHYHVSAKRLGDGRIYGAQ